MAMPYISKISVITGIGKIEPIISDCKTSLRQENEELYISKVIQLSNSVAFFKSIIPDMRKAIASAEKSINLLENNCQHLEHIISVKDKKIITLVDQIFFKTKYSIVMCKPGPEIEIFQICQNSETVIQNIFEI
ncbi:hypothetical protein C1645_840324 [Glomus cerebriforme]|uniref:Uncharacterized protein n=1 Tax=Glomus cerebriforme TaxID=658196 RepID=A0A397S277_9GLOM|nr:hypothetical protein C1645_840324 [Glomus cerebriforme]